jgi:hypothetical protein
VITLGQEEFQAVGELSGKKSRCSWVLRPEWCQKWCQSTIEYCAGAVTRAASLDGL